MGSENTRRRAQAWVRNKCQVELAARVDPVRSAQCRVPRLGIQAQDSLQAWTLLNLGPTADPVDGLSWPSDSRQSASPCCYISSDVLLRVLARVYLCSVRFQHRLFAAASLLIFQLPGAADHDGWQALRLQHQTAGISDLFHCNKTPAASGFLRSP